MRGLGSWILFAGIGVSILVLFILNLLLGSVEIPVRSIAGILAGSDGEPAIWTNIILKSRLPQSLTAAVAGAGLAVSGLLMQLGGKSRSGVCGVAFRQYRRGCPEPARSDG